MTPRFGRSGERGQTAPFWAVSIALALSLAFFTYNYANSVRWQIRAQNAADSAAAAILGQDAAVANDLTTLTYATQIQTVRDRSVGNAIAGLVGDVGGNPQCLQALATSCVTAYTDLAGRLATQTQSYDALVNSIPAYEGQLTDLAGNSASATALLNDTVFGTSPGNPTSGCIRLNTDCGFKYTATISLAPGGTGSIVADVYACRVVPTVAAGIVGSMVATQSKYFYAIGHARQTLAPASSGPTAPGRQTNDLVAGSGVLQPTEQISPNLTAAEDYTSFADTNIQANYLIPRPAPPSSATPASIANLCPPVPA